jgi:HAD superfamily hydrolase (TIGR01509 family)
MPRGTVNRPPVLMFDLGGVLVEVAVFGALKSMLGEAVDDDVIRERWLQSPAVRSFELGRVSPAVFASQFLNEWQLPLTPQAFLKDFGTWVKGPYDGAEELIAHLRTEHHVSCLSNCNEVHWTKMAPLLGCFDSAFSSHLLGAIKPDQGAFERVMNELHVVPGQLWFFDDSLSNVQATERLGIRAFLVRGIADTQSVLRSEGLI